MSEIITKEKYSQSADAEISVVSIAGVEQFICTKGILYLTKDKSTAVAATDDATVIVSGDDCVVFAKTKGSKIFVVEGQSKIVREYEKKPQKEKGFAHATGSATKEQACVGLRKLSNSF